MDSSVQSSSIVHLNSNGGIESTTKILSESDDIPQFKTTFNGLMINHDSEDATFTVHEDYTDHTNATYMQMWSMKFHEVSGKNFKTSGDVVTKFVSINSDLSKILFLFLSKSGPFLFKGSKNHCAFFIPG